MNLPLFGAEASGLFAEHGLDVELVRPPRRRPAGGAVPPAPVAEPAGAALSPPAEPAPAEEQPRPDFAVTAVQSRLKARARQPDRPQSRFVAVVHQHSPLAGFVKVDSPLRFPADLAGARVAASTSPWFDLEYDAGLEAMGIEPPVRVPRRDDGVRLSLADDEVEVIGSWDEAIAVIRHRAGVPVRSIPFGPQVYTTGVVAAEHVRPDVVARMVAALRAAFEQQRDEPELGLEELCRRFPAVDADGALEEWSVLEDYVFAGGQPLAMTDVQWEATIAHAARTYGLTPMAVAEVCREEMVATPVRDLA
jgi:ABC-type nitrate/sulfonate/bicarbonate transport system substrate-binding protein